MVDVRKPFTVGIIGIFLLTLSMTAQASIPVIDTENILQQIKTYTETLQVVTNTAQQITLQLKELEALPETVLNSYKNALDNSMTAVTGAMKKSSFYTENTEWNSYWQSTFPKIAVNTYPETFLAEQNVNTTLQEVLSMRNRDDVTTYHQLITELDTSRKRLMDLLELNKSPEGSKQAQQLANEIAAEKTHIDSINTAIQALTAQNQVMKNQAEVLKKQNHQTVVEAAIQAEDDALTKMQQEVTKTVPVLDDPWQTYGNVRW
ncbi:hypothetical protein [Propionispira raffinosivorans]|uniref:hypothetical protein n=1 Tax=Propionispira raffinosivorans TaxID=86959 RepID=UPI000369B954|nr:hypothetical protein [Propionispira raffinosivorans]